ncbi:MAG: trigger factor [Candidatus Marinimicrobia bacterium]|nr:trigger factor [Candidatus Neomarinimicrobiota bacterium]
MELKIEELGPCRRAVHISVPAAELAENRVTALKAYQRAARLPGFRPGKAPTALVQRRYAKEITEEVKDQLIGDAYRTARKEHQLDVVEVIDLKDLVNPEEGDFSATLVMDVAPTFALPDIAQLKIDIQETEVTAAQVDEALEALRRQMARYEDIPARPIARGDLVQIDYEGICEGRPVAELAAEARGLGSGQDFWFSADENAFLPEFTEGLLGAQPGEERTITVQFPEDFQAKTVAGKQAVYTVKIKALRERKLPELDQAFCDQLKVTNPATLRDLVEADLGANIRMRERERQQQEVVKQLLEACPFEVPESEVQRMTQSIVRDLVSQFTRQGIQGDQITERKDEIINSATQTGRERLRSRYILLALAKQENLTLSEAELTTTLTRMAIQQQMRAEEIRALFEKDGRLDSLRQDMLAQKTLHWLHDRLLPAAPIPMPDPGAAASAAAESEPVPAESAPQGDPQ